MTRHLIRTIQGGLFPANIGIALLCFLCLLSCGEDRSHEYYELTEQNRWIYDAMKDHYLWADDLQEPASKDFFGSGESFMKKLTQSTRRNDNWSYCTVDSAVIDKFERGNFNHISSYGLDVMLMTDPTGVTSRQMGRVTNVYPGSPAAQCKLHRGDFITMIDGERLGSSSTAKLKNGTSRQLEVCHLTADSVAFSWADTTVITLPPSTYIEDVPFPISIVIPTGPLHVAYIMVNRLTEGPIERDEHSTAYVTQLQTVMASLRAQHPDDVVLDLRYCNSGTIEQAVRLASCLVPESLYGKVFAKTEYNSHHQDQNHTYTFDAAMSAYNLGTSRIHIITSSYTQGAAEWLVQALRCAMPSKDVWVVGTPTKGQNVITANIASAHGHRLYPAVCYVNTADDRLMDVVKPDLELNELQYSELYDFGTSDEILLHTCRLKILGILDQEESEESSDEGNASTQIQ